MVAGCVTSAGWYTSLGRQVWRWCQPVLDAAKAHVTSFQGHYDTARQSGKVSLAGTLPAILPAFGDLNVDVNGHPYLARLIDVDGFQEAFENGGIIKYAKQGAIIVVDFGKKTWSASWAKSEDAVLDYSANLRLRQ